MAKRFFLTATIMMICLQGCSKPEPLETERIDYTGNELRTDGYYYYEYDVPTQSKTYRYIRFLFRNGVVLNVLTSDVANAEESFRDGSFYAANKDVRDRWGVFQVYDNKIKIEHWLSPGVHYNSKTYSSVGEILNNESFKIDELYDIRTFQFKEFEGKPDSVCRFISRTQ